MPSIDLPKINIPNLNLEDWLPMASKVAKSF